MFLLRKAKKVLFHCNRARDSVQLRFVSDIQKKIKQSYYHLSGDFLLSSSTVGQIIDDAADTHGDRVVFISPEQNISKTYTEFRNDVNKLASGLVSLGLKKGDKIAICAPNSYEWPVTQFATAKAGLILVNINPAYQQEELEFCLKKVQCKALVIWDTFKTQDFYETLCQIEPQLPNTNPNRFQSSKLPDLEKIIMISAKQRKGIFTLNEVFESANAESDSALAHIEKSVQFDDPVNIQFTSGTTGKPKGAMLSHHNIVNNAFVVGRRLGFNLMTPTACCQVPLFHCFGCVLACLGTILYNGTCVFPSSVYSVEANLKAIEKHKCTITYGTPTMYVDLLNTYKPGVHNVNSLKQAVIGGAPSTENLVKDIKERLQVPIINIAYGTTENSPGVAVSTINDDFNNVRKGIVPPLEFVETATMVHYKIVDYSYPTAGELARLILQYKEIEYEDEKVDSPDRIYEAEEESLFGVLPVLLVDGKVVGQQQGICRYLANELGLVGKDNEEAAACDMVMDALGAMFSKLRGSHVSHLDVKEQSQLLKQMIEEDVPRFLEKLEKFLVEGKRSSGYLVSEQLTWCDLGVALTLAGMQIRQPKLLDKTPRLAAFVEKVTANETVDHFINAELIQSAIVRKNSM